MKKTIQNGASKEFINITLLMMMSMVSSCSGDNRHNSLFIEGDWKVTSVFMEGSQLIESGWQDFEIKVVRDDDFWGTVQSRMRPENFDNICVVQESTDLVWPISFNWTFQDPTTSSIKLFRDDHVEIDIIKSDKNRIVAKLFVAGDLSSCEFEEMFMPVCCHWVFSFER